jgi:transcriptional regulator with XRE-family HTH domain
MNIQLITIKTKKLGVSLANCRQKRGISRETLSNWTGISLGNIDQIENGEMGPSLPQIEVIANKLGISFDELVSGSLVQKSASLENERLLKQYSELRDRLIGIHLKKQRIEKGLALDSLAEVCSVSNEKLEQYESGKIPIPYPVLEFLCQKLELAVNTLLAQSSPFSTNQAQTQVSSASQNTNQISDSLAEFINNPANVPYLELAKRLSVMDAAKLRSIAEGLLEITY